MPRMPDRTDRVVFAAPGPCSFVTVVKNACSRPGVASAGTGKAAVLLADRGVNFPGAEPFGHDPSGDPEPPDPLEDIETLTVLPSWTYRWTGTITTRDWTNRIATYSGHQRLGVTALADLQARVADVIIDFGGSITSHFGTVCLQARRN